MKRTPKKYAESLIQVLQEAENKDQDIVLDNFVRLLIKNNDLDLFPKIAEEYEKLEMVKQGVKKVKVVSAHKLDGPEEEQIKAKIESILDSKVQLEKEVDENVVGGVVIKADDWVLDASLKNYLKKLSKSMQS